MTTATALDAALAWVEAGHETVAAGLTFRAAPPGWEPLLGAEILAAEGGRDLFITVFEATQAATAPHQFIPRPVHRLLQALAANMVGVTPQRQRSLLSDARALLARMPEATLLRVGEVVAVGGPEAGAAFLAAAGLQP